MVLKQIADGLAAVHEKGIVHCNLSLANVQVYCLDEHVDCSEIMIKLGGFDLAAEQKAAEALNTCQAMTAGLTPPEVFELGHSAWTKASDVWCFGMLIWKMYSGKRSFLCASPSLDFALSEGLYTGLISSITKPELCPEGAWQLVQRCMVAVEEDRPSMQEVRRELDRLLLQLRMKQARDEEQQQRRDEIINVSPGPSAKRQRKDEAEAEDDEDSKDDEIDLDDLCQQALHFLHGCNDIVQDETKAAKILLPAAELGHANSQYYLAVCYMV